MNFTQPYDPDPPALAPPEENEDHRAAAGGLAPDAGMAQIAAAFRVDLGAAAELDTGPEDPQLALTHAMRGLTSEMARRRAWEERRFKARAPLTLHPHVMTISGGAGKLDDPDTLGPSAGWAWIIRRITAVGFTAGTVTMYEGGAAVDANNNVPFAQAGTFTFGRGEVYLMPGERLYFVAAGITGTVTISGRGKRVQVWALPEEL